MSIHKNIDNSEVSLVEKPLIQLFKNLNWKIYNAYNEFDSEFSKLGREVMSGYIDIKVIFILLLS